MRTPTEPPQPLRGARAPPSAPTATPLDRPERCCDLIHVRSPRAQQRRWRQGLTIHPLQSIVRDVASRLLAAPVGWAGGGQRAFPNGPVISVADSVGAQRELRCLGTVCRSHVSCECSRGRLETGTKRSAGRATSLRGFSCRVTCRVPPAAASCLGGLVTRSASGAKPQSASCDSLEVEQEWHRMKGPMRRQQRQPAKQRFTSPSPTEQRWRGSTLTGALGRRPLRVAAGGGGERGGGDVVLHAGGTARGFRPRRRAAGRGGRRPRRERRRGRGVPPRAPRPAAHACG
jgi:hypothetical protein